jgi:TPR repeat protein
MISGLVAWQVHKAKANHRLVQEATVARINAEHGDAAAALSLAHMNYYGQGVPQNYAEAARWYRSAADLGNAKSQFSLGYIYYYGQGVPQDYSEAVRRFRIAAEQGDVQAQVRARVFLAVTSYYGQGTPQNYVEAIRWYRMAADQGNWLAQSGLGSMYFYGQGVPHDYVEATVWYRKAADQGYAKAQYDLGTMYYSGLRVPQDRAEANRWFHKAAAQNNKDAKRALSVGLQTWGKLSVLGELAGGVALLTVFLQQGRSRWGREAALPFIGTFSVFTAIVSWYGYTHDLIWRRTSGVNAFTLFHWLLDAVLVCLLVYLVQPRRGSRTT